MHPAPALPRRARLRSSGGVLLADGLALGSQGGWVLLWVLGGLGLMLPPLFSLTRLPRYALAAGPSVASLYEAGSVAPARLRLSRSGALALVLRPARRVLLGGRLQVFLRDGRGVATVDLPLRPTAAGAFVLHQPLSRVLPAAPGRYELIFVISRRSAPQADRQVLRAEIDVVPEDGV